MAYIGNQPTSVAFLTDQFSANGSGTVFTLSAAPANTASIIVAVSGVLQDPSTYSVSGLTLTFSAAPPAGTGNISVRFLGIPASNVTTTAYRTLTEFTATAGQTTFTPPSYTAGYITVLRNGVQLGTADFTATNGTTVVLATGATAGDLITTESFYVSSVLNAIPATNGAVTTPYILDGAVTAAKMAASGAWAPAGTILQVVNAPFSTFISSTSTTLVATGITATITPKSTNSKILVLTTVSGMNFTTAATTNAIRTELYKNGSSISYMNDVDCYNTTVHSNGTFIYSDSPATTSATTYAVYWRNSGGGSGTTFYMNDYASGNNRTYSSITLMEIAG